ncbi:hypothetical protein E2C01_043083 [Portunus trituberculatus]|uniref:Uncharacterized protein n=1 Tax=Portunus trituberculatus TaxID=210409 RepID=A0A5B7FVC5_PORTR|nr:hypothetical protein [Portunus trituberculatus]
MEESRWLNKERNRLYPLQKIKYSRSEQCGDVEGGTIHLPACSELVVAVVVVVVLVLVVVMYSA